MLQEIIVYIILIISFSMTFYRFIGFFDLFKEKSNKSACGSCSSSSCGTCSIKAYEHIPKSVQPLKIDTNDIKPLSK